VPLAYQTFFSIRPVKFHRSPSFTRANDRVCDFDFRSRVSARGKASPRANLKGAMESWIVENAAALLLY
jgi:hypothetical protein